MEINLRNEAEWAFPLEMVDDEGAFDMTGRSLRLVLFDRKGAEIGRAATSGTAGTITIGGATLDVLIPVADRPPLTIAGEFILAYGDLFDVGGVEPEWLGRADFRILSGPSP
jgi:hypothetical protein